MEGDDPYRLYVCVTIVLIVFSTVLSPEWNVILLSGALCLCSQQSDDPSARRRAQWVLASLVIVGISTLFSIYLSNSIAASTILVEFLLLFLVCIQMPEHWRERLFWMTAIVLVSWESVAIAHGIWNVCAAKDLGFENLTPFRRIILTSTDRQVDVSSRLIPILYPLAGLRREATDKEPVSSVILFTLLVGAALYTTLTLSITAYLSYLPLAVVCLILPWRLGNHWTLRLRIAGRVCVLILPLATLWWIGWHSTIFPMIHPAEAVSRTPSISSRIVAQRVAWSAFRAHLWVGIGPGNFPLYAQEQIGQNYPIFREAYNTILRLLAEMGIGAILALAGALFLVGRALTRTKGTIRLVVMGELLTSLIFMSGEDLFSTGRSVHMGLAIVAALPLGNIGVPRNVREALKVSRVALAGSLFALISLLRPFLPLKDVIAELDRASVFNRTIHMNGVLEKAHVSSSPSIAEQTLRQRYQQLLVGVHGCDLCWRNAAWMDAIAEDAQGAGAAIEHSIALGPDNYLNELSAGIIEYRFGRLEIAAQHLAKSIELRPALIRSPLWGTLKSTAPALVVASEKAAFNRGLDTHDPVAHARFGQYLLLTGDIEGAKRELTVSSTSLPTLPVVWQELGYIAAQEGDWSHWKTFVTRCEWIRGTRNGGMENSCYQHIDGKLSFDIRPTERTEIVYLTRRRAKSLLIPRDYTTDLSIVFK